MIQFLLERRNERKTKERVVPSVVSFGKIETNVVQECGVVTTTVAKAKKKSIGIQCSTVCKKKSTDIQRSIVCKKKSIDIQRSIVRKKKSIGIQRSTVRKERKTKVTK